ncbi:MAG: hypothetical protein R2838_00015 [Caldilineaceae bacterium]
MGATWLPYLGFFNEAKMIGFLPQPLALTLGCNVILTLCVLALYPLYFQTFHCTAEGQSGRQGGRKWITS